MNEQAMKLNRVAMERMAAGDLEGAETVLQQALGADRSSIGAWLNMAAVKRQRNDIDGAFGAIKEVLTLDGRNFHALLMSATMLERIGQQKPAAAAYGIALANAPPDRALDAPTLRVVQHGRDVHAKHTRDLGDFVRAEAADAARNCSAAGRRRVETFIDINLRTHPRPVQLPSDYFYPGLPAIEFWEREEFPWLSEFESATQPIQDDLAIALREDEGDFAPYIQYSEHMPLDQWRELNHSPRWSAYHFYRAGRPIEERCARFPATLAAMAKLPQAELPLRSPCAMFSVLKPHTRIPAHTGVANFRLVVHLPLVVPAGCRFRVGGETREWRLGEAWVFDDTIEHEAWNDGDEIRIILICDVWNPQLSAEERFAIARVVAATDAYNGTVPGNHV
jgi:aspartyl/asparaginyl beta-hydroxylase (cupin superfamily)